MPSTCSWLWHHWMSMPNILTQSESLVYTNYIVKWLCLVAITSKLVFKISSEHSNQCFHNWNSEYAYSQTNPPFIEDIQDMNRLKKVASPSVRLTAKNYVPKVTDYFWNTILPQPSLETLLTVGYNTQRISLARNLTAIPTAVTIIDHPTQLLKCLNQPCCQ